MIATGLVEVLRVGIAELDNKKTDLSPINLGYQAENKEYGTLKKAT